MLKKLAPSFILASAVVGTMSAPSYASDDTFKSICQFPVRVVGCGVSTVLGVPLGAVRDGVRGSIKSTQWVAEKLGDESGNVQIFFGSILGGPFGAVGGGTYGVFDGSWHGMKTGYEKPFSKESFTFKDE